MAYSSSSAHRPPSQVEDAPPPPYSEHAPKGHVTYNTASTLHAWTNRNPSAGPSRLPTTFADAGKSSYRSAEDKKEAEVRSWETKFRTQVSTLDSGVKQLAKFSEEIAGNLFSEQQDLWTIEGEQVQKVDYAEHSLKDTLCTAMRLGYTWAKMETIFAELETTHDTIGRVKEEWNRTPPLRVLPLSISELYRK